ncbi:multisubstrate pseudouridine synthase 7 [Coemansia thaxteri]|uniref:Multisubstrate pseudouridine synthase 7 n=1 Tax=Coemansia thaxteri TaxID=2663907 RepID=A0A9W8BJJ3_9FUNG|nr:multisubstrate pseudouridine synthase 7 [Coemansia thaxteri]KAJ2004129.1 multisubstrate pseudouridine synthase 7 [Coemansia thaxteri]KAJ2467923.1 multisubstrate pseudouridine synthase 7 [Coemansia sp. RSA 2322]KAJ2485983.1 multisubstrate pseudouridine synthase 7 [Coemansia sp. RSA 2320]
MSVQDSDPATTGKRKNGGGNDGEALAKQAKTGGEEKQQSLREAKTDGEEEEQFLREADVGITQFVTAGWGGFDAIIKHRISDFFVNEIDTSGNVVRLTSYTDAEDPAPAPTEEQLEAAKMNVPDDPAEALDAAIGRLGEILGADDAARIRELLCGGAGREGLELERDLDKAQRKSVYTVTNNFLPKRVAVETLGSRLKFVRREPGRAAAAGDRRGRAQQWAHAGDFCYFVMQKENLDTMDVLSQIARALRASPRTFGMAGTKDKRGITVQQCSAYRVDHRRLIGVSRGLRGARLGNYSYAPRELRLGDLSGNRFEIVLRHVQRATEQSLRPVLDAIRATGFINYYGMQRFGTQAVSSHAVGVAVLKADWLAATDLILRPRPGDRKEVRRAREVWQETRDARAALALLPQRAALAEHAVLQAFARSGKASDAAGAFAAVPRNLRLMYVHAYQSFVWNSAASQRLARHGIAGPVVGDLAIKAAAFGEPQLEESSRVEPTLVTAQNIAQFSIYDVVLPLPGWAVTYPEHDIKGVYVSLMKQDGLSPFGLGKHPLKEYKLAGAYRHLLIRPRDFEFEWMRYNDDALPLARSDSDAIEGKHVPESIDFGSHVALKLKFDLPSSAYATMLLRELMRQETAAGHQTKQSSTHNSNSLSST